MHRSSPGTRTEGKRVPKCSEGFISGGVKTFLGKGRDTNRRQQIEDLRRLVGAFEMVGRVLELDGGSVLLRWWVGGLIGCF